TLRPPLHAAGPRRARGGTLPARPPARAGPAGLGGDAGGGARPRTHRPARTARHRGRSATRRGPPARRPRRPARGARAAPHRPRTRAAAPPRPGARGRRGSRRRDHLGAGRARAARRGAAGDPAGDPSRLATAAHAVLARTLRTERPLHAVHHALTALEAMPEIEDPPLRIGLITALLQALMAVGATAHATFTAGRLLSLQRTLGREELRIAPLLAVAAQRLQAERPDAAWVPLEQARTLAAAHRDRRALLEIARLAASLHERTGETASSLRELRILAHQARPLAHDLATPAAAQRELIRTELEAHALAMRRALDLGRTDAVT